MNDPGYITLRKIEKADNPYIARIIRKTLEEFGANRKGTVYDDKATDMLYELFSARAGSVYYVAEFDNIILGGGGIYPSEGLPPETCELVKMYLLPEGRGNGTGRMIMEKCLQFAKETGYKFIYIETMPELKEAIRIYQKIGFGFLTEPIGNTRHTGCAVWMLKKL